MLSAVDALIADLGLTAARMQVLGAIAGLRLPCRLLTLREHGTDSSSRTAAGERNGTRWIRAIRDQPSHHQRASLVLLTAPGRAAFEAATKRQAPLARELARGLTDKQIRSAAAVLKTMRQRLESDHTEAEDKR